MTKICTSIEQSKKLLELGLDSKSADMCYIHENEIPKAVSPSFFENFFNVPPRPPIIPAWSLSALLELIPGDNSLVRFDKAYRMVYDIMPHYVTPVFVDNEPIDAAFEMVVWMLENGKI